MSQLKKLVGQTAIYGLSSIIARLLNFLLVPWYTRIFTKAEYGIVTELYSYVAVLIVILTFGMETSFFRHSAEDPDKEKVFSTSLLVVALFSFLFMAFCGLFTEHIAVAMRYPDSMEYVIWFALIIGLDAISSIPLAKLRQQNRARRFMVVNVLNILINISLNVFFLYYCKNHYNEFGEQSNALVKFAYNPSVGVGYIFIANLISSVFKFVLLSPQMLTFRLNIAKDLIVKMLIYGFPLMLAGAVVFLNDFFSRIAFKFLVDLPGDGAMADLGVFGACIKVAVLMTLFVQAFKYAAEPFFFSNYKEKDSKQLFSDVLTYFVIACTFIYMAIMFNIDIVMYFIGEDFRSGVEVVPILLLANLFIGIYYNLSVWYKTTDRTQYAIYFGVLGTVITIGLNLYLIPIYGAIGGAWTTLICYFSMTAVSYIMGQRINKIPYNLSKIIVYISLAVLLVYIDSVLNFGTGIVQYIGKGVVLTSYAFVVYKIERPKGIILNQ
ncbi:MAG: oligosaccharide flippase family protein [Flavobacteriales bacterium]|nr:oligosaccharide flippase family protein [Flavobacteriales bacterium]